MAHLREVIIGWYAGFPGDQTMSSNVQNGFWQTTYGRDFIPQAWLEPKDGGTAPAGSETCTSKYCHRVAAPATSTVRFPWTSGNPRQLQAGVRYLGAGIAASMQHQKPGSKSKFMPLAHLTYQRYWQANASTGGTTQQLPYPAPPLNISNTADQIAQYLALVA